MVHVPLNLDIYVCERSEQEKNQTFKMIEKKNQQPKTIPATKNHFKKLCFGDFRGGGGRAGCAPP